MQIGKPIIIKKHTAKISFLTIFLFSSIFIFGQIKALTFSKKLTYESEIFKAYPGDERSAKITHYLSQDASLLNYYGIDFHDDQSFLTINNRIFEVYNTTLENNLKIKIPYYNNVLNKKEIQPYKNNILGDFISVKSLNSTTSINGYSCNEYELIYKEFDEVESRDVTKKSKICVDEKNKLDNASFLFSESKLRGLLVKFEMNGFKNFILKSVTDANTKVFFNEVDEIKNFEKNIN